MYKWPLRADVLSCWKPYLCFAAYLAFLSLVPGFSHTTVGGQGGELFASNRCYLYLQFIACFFVVGTAASLFEETFMLGIILLFYKSRRRSMGSPVRWRR